MNFKHAFKMFMGILTLFLLYGAVGGIDPLSAVAHAEDSPYISKTGVAGNDQLDTLSPKDSGKGWTCPMHTDVHKHEPGKCPICKMNLVKVKARNI